MFLNHVQRPPLIGTPFTSNNSVLTKHVKEEVSFGEREDFIFKAFVRLFAK